MISLIRPGDASSLASSLRWRMISVPRGRGPSAGVTEKLPVPSDSHCQPISSLVAARANPNAVGDHERRVETHAELADQREVGLLPGVSRKRLEELAANRCGRSSPGS